MVPGESVIVVELWILSVEENYSGCSGHPGCTRSACSKSLWSGCPGFTSSGCAGLAAEGPLIPNAGKKIVKIPQYNI